MFKKDKSGIIANIVLALFSLVFVIPFILVISISLSQDSDLATYGYTLLPKAINFDAYRVIFANPTQLINSYGVTTFSSAVGTVLGVLIMAMVAYPLSRSTFSYRKIIMFFILFTMLFGGGLIPSYIVLTRYLKLGNTIWIHVLSGLINAFHIIILRTFFKGIPSPLIESAKIDGASEFRIFFEVILPLATPALATVAVFTVLARWNEWQVSLIYIRDAHLFSLQYLLQKILQQAEFVNNMAKIMPGGIAPNSIYELPAEGMRFAMVVVTTGPMLFVFMFFQKYFAKGLTVGAVKG